MTLSAFQSLHTLKIITVKALPNFNVPYLKEQSAQLQSLNNNSDVSAFVINKRIAYLRSGNLYSKVF